MSEATLIPLFPLSLVAVPEEKVPLHIFEMRYRDMVADCRAGEAEGKMLPFGISHANNDGDLAPVGCTVKIVDVAQEYDDGRIDIITRGDRRYHLEEIDRSKSYYQAWVTFFDDEEEDTYDLDLRRKVVGLHARLIERVKGKSPRLTLKDDRPASFLLSQNTGVSAIDKQKLLEMTQEDQRMHYLLKTFTRLLSLLEEADDVKQRIRANGYFRKIRGVDLRSPIR